MLMIQRRPCKYQKNNRTLACTFTGLFSPDTYLIPKARLLSAKVAGKNRAISGKPRFARAAELESPKPGFARQEGNGCRSCGYVRPRGIKLMTAPGDLAVAEAVQLLTRHNGWVALYALRENKGGR